jgi:DNA-binding NarL/FixJ family response regulator
MSREVVVFVEDIFYTAKIREAARTASRDVRFVRDAGALERRLDGPAPGMVIMDLNAETLHPLDMLRKIKGHPEWKTARIVAYSSLSRAELMQEANQLGAEVVLPKTSFTQQLPEILQSAPA